jgi:aryl-alcohol dehydrogenase-like predicted oxidoreductase
VKVGILAASPLARGLLGRQYSAGNPPAKGHPLRGRKGHLIWTDRNLALATRLREIARANQCPPVQLALGLVLALPLVASVLVRPTAVSDLDDYLTAPARKPSASDLTYILEGGAGTTARSSSITLPLAEIDHGKCV